MKKRIPFFEKNRIKYFLSILSLILSVFSATILFLPWNNYVIWQRIIVLSCLLLVVISIYIGLYIWAVNKTHISIKINNTSVEIKRGDILSYRHDALKVITFNEYFDTVTDNVLVAEKTLNGAFIKKFYSGSTLKSLDDTISNSLAGQGKTTKRAMGKREQYRLGTICEVSGGYALLAFSKFDTNNKAYLTREDYMNCLLMMWQNLDKVYAGREIVLPLMGAGILRIGKGGLSQQEVLEAIIYSLKISGMKFKNVTILFDDEASCNIDLYKTKNFYV